MEDQLKVIREDVLYTSNEVDQILQVIERFNQRLFSMEARLKAVEEGLRTDAVVKAQLALESQYQRHEEVEDQK